MHKTAGRRENDVRLYDCNKKETIFIDDTTEAGVEHGNKARLALKPKNEAHKNIVILMTRCLIFCDALHPIESDMQH